MEPAAAAPHLMLVILRDAHAQRGDLVLLVAIHHTEIGGLSQIITALAAPRRVPVHLIIRLLNPGRVRARSTRLLTRLAFRSAALSGRLDRRWPASRIIVFGRWQGGVPGVATKAGAPAGPASLPAHRSSHSARRSGVPARPRARSAPHATSPRALALRNHTMTTPPNEDRHAEINEVASRPPTELRCGATEQAHPIPMKRRPRRPR